MPELKFSVDAAREIIGNAAEQHRTSAALDSGNPIGRKLKASHLADGSVAAVEPGGIAHRCLKASFVENTQFGRAIEAVDLQALSFACQVGEPKHVAAPAAMG